MQRSLLALLVLGLISTAVAADKTLEDQYLEASAARTRAELAIRKARSFFEENENRWRSASFAQDSSRTQISQAIQLAIQEEQRRPEDMRNLALIEDLQQRNVQVDRDWQRFASVERPNVDQFYRLSSQLVNTVAQSYQILTQVEPTWKDAKVEMPALQAAYDAIANRADGVRTQAKGALNQHIEYQKSWETRAAAATQPTR